MTTQDQSSPDLLAQVRVLRHEAGAVPLGRDVVRAEGDAAVDYLQGQLSQEVASLAPGRSAWSFVLQPQGKVDVWFRVTRLAEDSFLFDTDPGWGDPLIARLERFRLSTPVTFTPLPDWSVLAIRGATATAPPTPADPEAGVVIPVDHPGNQGWDLIGPSVAIPAGVVECDSAALEVLRIEAGMPAMGREITEATIPAEAGVVPMSVSFTKGCYTGQELVARIDSRGSRTPRRLVGLVVNGNLAPSPEAEMEIEGANVGRVTSVADAGSHGGPVALAYLARRVDTPAEVVIEGPPGASDNLTATAVDLPIEP